MERSHYHVGKCVSVAIEEIKALASAWIWFVVKAALERDRVSIRLGWRLVSLRAIGRACRYKERIPGTSSEGP